MVLSSFSFPPPNSFKANCKEFVPRKEIKHNILRIFYNKKSTDEEYNRTDVMWTRFPLNGPLLLNFKDKMWRSERQFYLTMHVVLIIKENISEKKNTTTSLLLNIQYNSAQWGMCSNQNCNRVRNTGKKDEDGSSLLEWKECKLST